MSNKTFSGSYIAPTLQILYLLKCLSHFSLFPFRFLHGGRTIFNTSVMWAHSIQIFAIIQTRARYRHRMPRLKEGVNEMDSISAPLLQDLFIKLF